MDTLVSNADWAAELGLREDEVMPSGSLPENDGYGDGDGVDGGDEDDDETAEAEYMQEAGWAEPMEEGECSNARDGDGDGRDRDGMEGERDGQDEDGVEGDGDGLDGDGDGVEGDGDGVEAEVDVEGGCIDVKDTNMFSNLFEVRVTSPPNSPSFADRIQDETT